MHAAMRRSKRFQNGAFHHTANVSSADYEREGKPN